MLHRIKKLFIPHHHNNYRPHAFRHKSLAVYCLLLIVGQLSFGVFFCTSPIPSEAKTQMKQEIISLTNEQRKRRNLSFLTPNILLEQAAQNKAADMFNKNYWDHTSPDGKEPWDFVEAIGYNYSYAGENLARGFKKPESVISAWMNSPNHKENILNSNFEEIGIAVVSGKIGNKYTTIIVQLFATPTFGETAQTSSTQVRGIQSLIPNLSTENPTLPERKPYFVFWILIFSLLVVDGIMLFRLGLHKHPKHKYSYISAIAINIICLLLLFLNFASIA